MNQIQLERHLLYSIIVAGKSAKFTEGVIRKLFSDTTSPFDQIRSWMSNNTLESKLREARSGNYIKLTKAFTALVNSSIDLYTCSPHDLEMIHGIGRKTSRYFIISTRPNENYAALDVHTLRWLLEQGYDVPKSTPTGKKYYEIENIFLLEAKKLGLTSRELDVKIWNEYNKSGFKS
jgi:thermostable 8-oxoguanine DNA glycosylase